MSRPSVSHRRLSIGFVLFASLAAVAGSGHAQNAEQRIDNRQDRQEQRIEHGIRSGALTPHETRLLARQQAGVVRAEGRAEADGTVTRREAAALERRQDRASRSIHRQQHDRQRSGR